MDRRSFIGTCAILSASGFLSKLSAANIGQLGIQLYTLRIDLNRNLEQTFEALQMQGYNYVEVFQLNKDSGYFFGKTPKELQSLLKQYQLIPKSLHIQLGAKDGSTPNTVRNGIDRIIDDAAALGVQYLVVPNLPSEERSLDAYKAICDLFNTVGEKVKKSGMQFAYHNHAFEFELTEGQIPYDRMLEWTQPELVGFEMDLYWVHKGGKNPIDYFKKYPGRFKLWHVKDMDKTANRGITEVGNGIIDFAEIFRLQKLSGMQHFFVEQDYCPGPVLISTGLSSQYLKKLKY